MNTRDNFLFSAPASAGISLASEFADSHFLRARPPFIGREAELQRLDAFFSDAINSSGKVVLVSGEPGVGKTRLLDEFGKMAQERGAEVLKTSAMAGFSSVPGHPLLLALEGYASRNSSRQHEMPQFLGELLGAPQTDAVPRQSASNVRAVGGEAGWEKTQVRIFESINYISQEAPFVLVIDDIQLADRATVQFVEACPTRLAQSRVLLVLVNSRGELGAQGLIPTKESSIFRKLRENKCVEIMELGRLDEEDTRSLVHKYLAKSDVSSEFPYSIYRRTDGNPLLVTEEIRSSIASGNLYQAGGVWYDRPSGNQYDCVAAGVGGRLGLLLNNLMAALDDEKRSLVMFASVIGYCFPVEILEVAMNEERADLVMMVEELSSDFRFLLLDGDVLKFVHPVVRERLLESMTRDERARLNRLAAAAVEKSGSLGAAEKVHLLAHHLWEAGEREAAVPYLLNAASLLASSSAYQEASRNLEKADLVLSCERGNAVELLAVKLQLGRLHELLGNWDKSLQYCEDAISLADRLNDRVSKSQALLTTGIIEMQRGDAKHARYCFETALAAAGDLDPGIMAVACYRIGSLYFEESNWVECERRYMEAMKYAVKLKTRVLVARIYNNLGAMESSKGNTDRATEWFEKCLPVYEEENDQFGLASTLHNIAMAHLDNGNFKEAQSFFGKSLAISDRTGVSSVKCFSFIGRAECALGLRDVDTAEEYAAKALHLLSILESEIWFGGYERIMGMIEREKGIWVKAEEHLESALNTFRTAKNTTGAAETEYEMGILFMAKGEVTRASGWLKSAARKFELLSNQKKVAECRMKLDEIGR